MNREQQPDPAPSETAKPKPRKRFRLEKLEERIAPAAHFNPHTKWVGAGNDGISQATTDTGWSTYSQY